FNVISAEITVAGMTFYSKPLSEFDTTQPATTTNQNRTAFSDMGNNDQVTFTTYSNTTIGAYEARSMMLRFNDAYSDALTLGEYPTDLSAFEFGMEKDMAQLSLGIYHGSTSTSAVSTWGTVRVVSEPASAALLALGGALLV